MKWLLIHAVRITRLSNSQYIHLLLIKTMLMGINMLKDIAKAFGIAPYVYNDKITLRLVMEEIERLQEVEQACRWNRNISRYPETRRRTVIEMYESWNQ
jgi:hypothetical protein